MLAWADKAVVELVFVTIGSNGIMRRGIIQSVRVRRGLLNAGCGGQPGKMVQMNRGDVLNTLNNEVHVLIEFYLSAMRNGSLSFPRRRE